MDHFVMGIIEFLLGIIKKSISFIVDTVMVWQENGFLDWVAKNWIKIAIIMVIVGFIVDQAVYIFVHKPYYSWIRNIRKIRNFFMSTFSSIKNKSYISVDSENVAQALNDPFKYNNDENENRQDSTQQQLGPKEVNYDNGMQSQELREQNYDNNYIENHKPN